MERAAGQEANMHYTPGQRVKVLIANKGWRVATYIGATAGCSQVSAGWQTMHAVETRDGKLWRGCHPACVRPA